MIVEPKGHLADSTNRSKEFILRERHRSETFVESDVDSILKANVNL